MFFYIQQCAYLSPQVSFTDFGFEYGPQCIHFLKSGSILSTYQLMIANLALY